MNGIFDAFAVLEQVVPKSRRAFLGRQLDAESRENGSTAERHRGQLN